MLPYAGLIILAVEDVKTGKCLANVGVRLVVDTRDLVGQETLLPPMSLEDIHLKLAPDWYTKNAGCRSDLAW